MSNTTITTTDALSNWPQYIAQPADFIRRVTSTGGDKRLMAAVREYAQREILQRLVNQQLAQWLTAMADDMAQIIEAAESDVAATDALLQDATAALNALTADAAPLRAQIATAGPKEHAAISIDLARYDDLIDAARATVKTHMNAKNRLASELQAKKKQVSKLKNITMES